MNEEDSAQAGIDKRHESDAFSFTRSVEQLGQVWETSFEDHKVRLPLKEGDEEDSTLVEVEERARIALGLGQGNRL